MKNRVVLKANGEFGSWLAREIELNGLLISTIAFMLKIKSRTILRHLKGEILPTFPMVVAYCWCFNSWSSPNDVWKMVEHDRKSDIMSEN